jgi:signal transduction histidine kinase
LPRLDQAGVSRCDGLAWAGTPARAVTPALRTAVGILARDRLAGRPASPLPPRGLARSTREQPLRGTGLTVRRRQGVLRGLRANLRQQPLSYRILILTLLWSLAVTTASTLAHLWSAYREELAAVERRFRQIEHTYVPSMTRSLWDFDVAQIEVMLNGLLALPDISSVEVRTADNERFHAGEVLQHADARLLEQRRFALLHQRRPDRPLGYLQVQVSREPLYARLRAQVRSIALSQASNVFLVSLFVFLLFQWRVNRHLRRMATYAGELRFDRLDIPLQLKRGQRHRHGDELDQVAEAINRMREGLRQDITAREQAEAELQRHRDHLEETVAQRTEQLQRRSEELQLRSAELEQAKNAAEQALQDLRATQDKLVQVEKMASLGSLVAGVAHEINTPLGIALTCSTHLEQETRSLHADVEQGSLRRQRLTQYLEMTKEATALIFSNLDRAARLVQSFKQVSVDQSTDDPRRFEVYRLVDELLASIHSLWRKRDVEVENRCPPQLQLFSYPGSLGQVLINLIQNALIHGLAEDQPGRIEIGARALPDQHIELWVRDSGRGMDQATRERIFDPFFTTRRNRGGTGLGMHIVFNIVSSKLGGSIHVESAPGQGCEVRLTLPPVPPSAAVPAAPPDATASNS